MNKKAIIIIIVVLVLAVMAWAFRKKIAKLLAIDSPTVNADKVLKNAVAKTAPADETNEPEDAGEIEANEQQEDPEFAFNEAERSVIVNGVKYVIPNAAKMASVQRNLIEGFEYLANGGGVPNALNPIYSVACNMKGLIPCDTQIYYKKLVENMIAADEKNVPATGVDGRMNEATARAFAECVRIMPGVVANYIV